MRRYEGLLRPLRSPGHGPARWLIIATQSGGDVRSADERSRTRALGSWHGALCTTKAGLLCAAEEYSGKTAAGALALAERVASLPGPTWIVSPGALEAWAMIGVWSALERGQLGLAQRNGGGQIVGWDRGTGLVAGCLALGCPPTLAALRFTDSGARALFLGAENYWPDWIDRGRDARSDCQKVVGALAECSYLLQRWRLGAWGVTAGAMALRGWRSIYQERAYYLSTGPAGDHLEWGSRCGGRLFAQVSRQLVADAVALDACALYPWIAAHRPQGVELERRGLTGEEAEREVRDRPEACIALVTVDASRPIYPRRDEHGTHYERGQQRLVLCGPELALAVRSSEMLAVHVANVYRTGLPLARYERRLWDARRECERERLPWSAGLCKRLAVSVVGKMAQTDLQWEEQIADYDDPLWGEWESGIDTARPVRHRARAGVVERCHGASVAPHALTSVALWVWSWARAWMLVRMDVAGWDHVLYADTDGLIVDREGHERLRAAGLVQAGNWGQLRQIGPPAPLTVLGARHYKHGERVVWAGMPVRGRTTSAVQGERWVRPVAGQAMNDWSQNKWVEVHHGSTE